MKSFRNWGLALVVLAASFAAAAQQFTVGTGSAGNTYSRQFNEISKVCSRELAMVEAKPGGKNSTGAVQNAEMLLANEINGGWVQVDILHMMARTQDMSDLKTLLVMHPEALHFIVKADFAVKQGGTMGFGGTNVPIRELTQIGGMNVAASGGALWTAKQVRLDTEIPFNVVEALDNNQARKLLDEGKANVWLLVGGAPVDMVRDLGPGYRILTIPESLASKTKAYVPARVSYAKLADGGAAQTLAVQANFVVRDYKSPKMVNALSALRNCVLTNLNEIKETTGNHASWRLVKAEAQEQSKWPLYQFSSAAPAAKK
jgi:uncharacterized protein